MKHKDVRRHTTLAVATTATLALTLAACSSGGSTDTSSDGGGGGGGGEATEVTVWASVDQPVLDGLQEGSNNLTEGSNITIKWEKVENINQLIMTKLGAADAPDIALIPQPGVVADVVSRNGAFPLDDVVDKAALESSMVPGTLESGTVDGQLYGLLVSMNVKGLVFYNKPAWDAAGYGTPATIDELNALTEQIKADGNVPWCMGIESDTATGWPATDWFEVLISKYGGADQYNQWVSHDILFDSPLVREAAAEFETLAFTDGNVFGGRNAIAATNFGTAGNPMFDAAGPKCWMLQQGSFITGFFPEETKADLDTNVGLFGFPPATAGGDNPVVGGGDLAIMLNEDQATKDAMAILANGAIGEPAAPGSSFISPHKDFNMELYPNQVTKDVAQVAYDSTAFLFDGSDQMPGEVGAGTFWSDMTSWIAGSQDLDTTLTNIDSSWPN
ncbi:ABC transporter substrate-binding protein [Demequina sp.]|uniref:ABC transporter substrate-binding protein n=1 Tax=Demequina sp. TaxID=2050685 RepID=UPI0025D7D7C0|nr:ABC transporter substrate-binding protein [Demequina sp.]